MDRVTLLHGDSLVELKTLDDNSIDSIVTDPPYALGFMGKAWDTHTPGGFQHWCELWAREALRVLKPGGHLLAFGGTRTYHRLTAGIEDAGFEIRDSLHWLYGSGFPKSLDVSKAIDKAAGAEREVTGVKPSNRPNHHGIEPNGYGGGARVAALDTAPATDAAKQWQGWGTALKPAHEPIVLARKPLAGTVAANVLQYGTGAINVDGCRVDGASRPLLVRDEIQRDSGEFQRGSQAVGSTVAGRWPANVLLDEDAARVLDEQAPNVGNNGQKHRPPPTFKDVYGNWDAKHGSPGGPKDKGGASRFFPVFKYQAKASRRERPEVNGVKHPTVKPVELMRWLVRLITPPNGVVLDPFAGSGATVEAALLEGMRCIAIEREAEYLPLIESRIGRQAA